MQQTRESVEGTIGTVYVGVLTGYLTWLFNFFPKTVPVNITNHISLYSRLVQLQAPLHALFFHTVDTAIRGVNLSVGQQLSLIEDYSLAMEKVDIVAIVLDSSVPWVVDKNSSWAIDPKSLFSFALYPGEDTIINSLFTSFPSSPSPYPSSSSATNTTSAGKLIAFLHDFEVAMKTQTVIRNRLINSTLNHTIQPQRDKNLTYILLLLAILIVQIPVALFVHHNARNTHTNIHALVVIFRVSTIQCYVQWYFII